MTERREPERLSHEVFRFVILGLFAVALFSLLFRYVCLPAMIADAEAVPDPELPGLSVFRLR
jgi:hypothetical protein